MREFSAFAPGRTELAGNHVDHQGGRVIAAAITCGITAHGRLNGEDVVRVSSQGFDGFELCLSQNLSPQEGERQTSAAILRGCAFLLAHRGLKLRGFDLQVSSSIPAGGGLSSSAAFELLLLRCLELTAENATDIQPLSPLDAAMLAQQVENQWFGKPCGLMDQMAIACGGVSFMDFANPAAPVVSPLPACGLEGIDVVLVDSGARHDGSKAQGSFASIPEDMTSVARELGCQRLRDVDYEAFSARRSELESSLGRLAVARGEHFFLECSLVDQRAQALREGDVSAYLEATRESGLSSEVRLENIGTAASALAIAKAQAGSYPCRIHGGGFGGSIQAYVPPEATDKFVDAVQAQLGQGCCTVLQFEEKGAGAWWA